MNKELLKITFNKSQMVSFLKIFTKQYQVITFNIIINDNMGKCYLSSISGIEETVSTTLVIPLESLVIIDQSILENNELRLFINFNIGELKDALNFLNTSVTIIIYEERNKIKITNGSKEKITKNIYLDNNITAEMELICANTLARSSAIIRHLTENIKSIPHIRLDSKTLSCFSKSEEIKIMFRNERKSEIILGNKSKELIYKVDSELIKGNYKTDINNFNNISALFIKKIGDSTKNSKVNSIGLYFLSLDTKDRYDCIVCIPLREKESALPIILKNSFVHLIGLSKLDD